MELVFKPPQVLQNAFYVILHRKGVNITYLGIGCQSIKFNRLPRSYSYHVQSTHPKIIWRKILPEPEFYFPTDFPILSIVFKYYFANVFDISPLLLSPCLQNVHFDGHLGCISSLPAKPEMPYMKLIIPRVLSDGVR